jgi:hypothetical protein
VNPPSLRSPNKFKGLAIEEMVDTGTEVDTGLEHVHNNGRGSQVTEPGAPEACLIPIPKPIPETVETKAKPKKGEKHFVRSARLEREILLDIAITTLDTHSTISLKALLDNGATGLFIDRKFVHQNSLKTRVLPDPIKVYNVDGTLNQGGSITEEVTLMLTHKGHKERAVFEVCDLGKATVIIGQPWLHKHNPEINWRTGEVKMTRCPRECNVFIRNVKKEKKRQKIAEKWRYQPATEEVADEEYYVRRATIPEESETVEIAEEVAEEFFIRKTDRPIAWGTKDLNPQVKEGKPKSLEEMVPERFHQYLKIFEKKASERMPVRKVWDHAIDMKPGFEPKKAKIIPLSPQEQKEVEEFLNDQLNKGYIRESKSPQTSAVFFVPKKDMRKRMVQDYRYLNSWTVRNNYPLPLINELVDKVAGAKYFSKFDLRWGYNNIRIREGDEWKAAFSTHRGAFEPLVMYFGLMNSPATFQTMMNSILRDLSDQGVVVVYIDDILVFTKTEEEHDEIVEEVLKRLEENDLFLKPEKCVFKQREVEFLGLYIGQDGIRMDEIKTKAITEWPVPKKVKDIQ